MGNEEVVYSLNLSAIQRISMSSAQSISANASSTNKELLFRLYGSPSSLAFSQMEHRQKGLGVGVAPPEPKIVNLTGLSIEDIK